MNTKQFYDSKRWQVMRDRVLRRDHYQCRECRRYGRIRQAVTVHHIKHLDEYPEEALNPDNLVSLCASCHNKAHPEKTENARRGYSDKVKNKAKC